MIALSIKIFSKVVKKKLKDFEKAMEKRVKLNRRIGIKALAEIDKQFRTEGLNFNTPWASLDPLTLERRRKGKSKGGTKILRDTGRLAASFTFKADNTKVLVGTNLKYSRNHQKGTTVPQREMLPEDGKLAYEKIAKPISEDYVAEEIRKVNR